MRMMNNIMNKNSKPDTVALLFNIVFWRILPTKIAFCFWGDRAESIVTAAIVILCFVIYALIIIENHFKLIVNKGFWIPIIGIIVFSVSSLLTPNDYLNEYFVYYFRYIVGPLIFLLAVKNYQYLLQVFCVFGCITFIFLGLQPLLASDVFLGNYMEYGFWVSLPAAIIFYTLRRQSQKKYIFCFEAITFFMLLVYSNRSSVLCFLIYVFMYNLIIEKASNKKLGFIALCIILAFVVAIKLDSILQLLLNIANNLNYNSHSLNKLNLYINGGTIAVFSSGRDVIYQRAIEMIKQNFPFGNGVGTFDTFNGVYSHNIFLDMMLYWGLFGEVVFLCLFVKIILSILTEKNTDVRIFKLIMFCLWFPKLVFSSTFTYDTAFWISLTLSFIPINKYCIIEENRIKQRGL